MLKYLDSDDTHLWVIDARSPTMAHIGAKPRAVAFPPHLAAGMCNRL